MERVYDLTAPAAAQRLKVHVETLKRWVRAGALPAMQTPGGQWRFSEADLDAFIERRVAKSEPEPAA